jgi:hypothetical protein
MTKSNSLLSDFDRKIRLMVYRHFADTGRALAAVDVAAKLQKPKADVEDSFRRLEAVHAWALAPATVNIWMAFPFSAVPTPFLVEAAGRQYWANCAWDALSLPAILELNSQILARCADCGSPITLPTQSGSLSASSVLIHFAVPPRRFWENVAFT